MEITKTLNGTNLEIALEGRLDSVTSADLEKMLKESLNPGIGHLVFDFGKLDYISSAGLRVILSAQKTMNKQGKMLVRHVVPEVMEVFEITGFCDIINIE